MKSQAMAIVTSRYRASDFLTLAKPRVNLLVIATTLAGYYMAAGEHFDLVVMFNTVMGTGLVAAGAAALNQVYERDVDGLMKRTSKRPLPDGRLQPADAHRFALVLSLIGSVQLALGANVLAALVAVVTLISYIGIYTPLKRHTPFAILIGAVPGALPPLIGWAAARDALDLGGWVLVAIVFLWQLPHFLAIAWIYREDYARAGFPMLPVIEPEGRRTARQVLVAASALVPVSLLPALLGLSAGVYVVGAVILGTAFLAIAAQFAFSRTPSSARRLFVGSIAYLPLLWILMIASKN